MGAGGEARTLCSSLPVIQEALCCGGRVMGSRRCAYGGNSMPGVYPDPVCESTEILELFVTTEKITSLTRGLGKVFLQRAQIVNISDITGHVVLPQLLTIRCSKEPHR